MKIKSLSATNFAEYDKVTVSFDDRVTYLVGKNGAGKSTLGVTLIWFILQGIAEKASANTPNPLIGERFRFIGPNGATAKGEMIVHDEEHNFDVKITRKLTKTGTELSFVGPKDIELNQAWLNDLFNIFMIAPKRFTQLSSIEQAKALGIDTSDFDRQIKGLKTEYTIINREYRNMGEIEEVDMIEPADMEALLTKKEQVRQKLNKQYHENVKTNKDLKAAYDIEVNKVRAEIDLFNEEQKVKAEHYQSALECLNNLKLLGYEGTEVEDWMENDLAKPEPAKVYPVLPEPKYVTEMPDDAELVAVDKEISDATTVNLMALEYRNYLKKIEAKIAKEQELNDNKAKQEEKEQERLSYIQNFKLPFKNLTVDEEGNLLLHGKPIKEPYFSTGELLKIVPRLITARKPELKYIFLQDFNLLDKDMQAEVEKDLTSKGFQLVVEYVGEETVKNKNCILLKDNVVVGSENSDEEIDVI